MDKISIQYLLDKKKQGKPITMLTAYDYPTALLLDRTGIEMILVGDSLGMVVYGFENTLPVTMDMMIQHSQAVRRGVKKAFLVGDMPFMSYQISIEEALRNAGRLLAEGQVDAVKLEGGVRMTATIRRLVESGIAVMAHIGLTPQSVSAFGGFKVQGKTIETARQLVMDAKAVEDAGAFSIVLEGIPARLATYISRQLTIPTIGIGAGSGCDGQVLVIHDILGLYQDLTPKFVKKYADIADQILTAVSAYQTEVENRTFPAPEHEFTLPDAVWEAIGADLNPPNQSEG